MAFNARNANFKALKKLNLRQRIDAVNDVSMGRTLISMLTPTQAAELFPKYYLNDRYDIGGFLKAIPSSLSAAKQRAYEEQINNTASGSSAGANFNAGGYKKTWQQEMTREQERSQITRKGQTPPPQLSPEQRDSFNALKSGDIDINDARMKWLKNAPADVLQKAGISTVKDDKGNEKFHYAAPQISDEQAKKSIVSGSSPAIESLKSEIAKGEGDYNAYNRGVAGDTPASARTHRLTDLSVAQIMQMQAGGKGNREFFAVGKYQFIPDTLREAVRWAKIDPNTKFDAATQEKLFGYLISAEKRPVLNAYLTGKTNNREAALNDLAREFASIPMTNGQSAYAGVGGNSSFGGIGRAEKIMGILERAKSTYNDPISQDFTPQQIEAIKEQLASQEEAQRLGSLAAMTQPNGPENAQGPINEGTAKLSGINAHLQAGSGHCGVGTRLAAGQLFKSDYFQNGIGGDGTAASLSRDNNYFQNSGFYKNKQNISIDQASDHAYLDSLPIGTVVSAAGGNAKGQGHVQIKLGGNRWVSFFEQNKVLTPGKTRDYHDYAVHLPNEKGLERMQQLGYSTQVKASGPPDTPTADPNIEIDQTQETAKPETKPQTLAEMTQPNGPENAAGPIAQQQAPQQQQAPTAKPEAPKPAAAPGPERYNVNTAQLANAIRGTQEFKDQAGMFAGMVSDNTIINGFKNDPRVKAMGVNLDDKGVMTFSKGQNDEIKKMMADFNAKSFMSKIEDKPATQVKAMAEGGTVPVNTDKISAYPITDMKNDNTVVVNAQQRPLFTMNTDEGLSIDPESKKATVTPNKKQTGIGPTPKQDGSSAMMQEFSSTISEIKKDFATLKTEKTQRPEMSQGSIHHQSDWLNKTIHEVADPFKSAAVRRVASRAQGAETGDPIGGHHYSRGTNI